MNLLRRVAPDFKVNVSGNGDPAVFKELIADTLSILNR